MKNNNHMRHCAWEDITTSVCPCSEEIIDGLAEQVVDLKDKIKDLEGELKLAEEAAP